MTVKDRPDGLDSPVTAKIIKYGARAQVAISLDGDEAIATAYFHNPMPMDDGQGGTKVVEFGGLYHHTLVRTADGWRSRKLHEEIVWKRGL